MCVICIKPAGVAIPDIDAFRSAHESNPHGAGFMVADPKGDKVVVRKGFFNPYDMYEAVAQTGRNLSTSLEDLNMVFHWRFATHGSHSVGNCHPFPLTDDLDALKVPQIDWCGPVMAHNGVFGIEVPSDERDLSDTQYAIMMAYSQLTFDDIASLPDKNIPYLAGNRIVVLDPSGRITRKGSWVDDEGCSWSNNSYRRYSSSFSLQETSYEHNDEPEWLADDGLSEEDFIESGGGYCPSCYQTDVDSGEVTPGLGPGEMVRQCRCNDCEATWVEVYQLVSAEVQTKGGENA